MRQMRYILVCHYIFSHPIRLTQYLLGLIDYVSDSGETTFARAHRLALQIADSAPLALRAAKQAINKAPELSIEEGLVSRLTSS